MSRIRRVLNTGARFTAAASLLVGAFLASPVNAQLATADTPNGPLTIPYPQTPTDVTGPGGSLGHAQNLRHLLLGQDRNTLPDSCGLIVATDPRYNFTRVWTPLRMMGARVAMTGVQTLSAVIPSGIVCAAPLPVSVVAPFRDLDATRAPADVFVMPTANAAYSLAACDQISLKSGALMIKTSNNLPAFVTSNVNGQPVTLRISRGAYAMVSAFDGHLTVANLTDNASDAVVIFAGDRAACTSAALPVRIGQLADVYPCAGIAPNTELVSYMVLNKTALSNGLVVETTRMSYPRALKRFNITRSIDDCDLRRLMKSAAAVSYMDREREWNGYLPTTF